MNPFRLLRHMKRNDMNRALLPNRRLAVAAAALALASGAWAQGTADDTAQALLQLAQAEAHIERQVYFNEDPDALAVVAGELGSGRVVKGAPYCADAVHETVQWLPDGNGGAPNRIVRQQTSRLCRDGDGRTRQEVERNGRKLVYLRDPGTRESWVLDPEKRTARRIGTPGALPGMDASTMRDFSERMREWAGNLVEKQRSSRPLPTPPTPPMPPTSPTPPNAAAPPAPAQPVIITRSDDGVRQSEVRILQLSTAEAGEWAFPPPPVQWRAVNLAPRGGGSVNPLPPRDFDGVRAHGERTTWVIEAGKVGNEKPIQIVREVWTAPELMLTVSSRDFDPRSGEVNYRLKGLKRGEPDAALMRVPADYKQPTRPGSKASQPTG